MMPTTVIVPLDGSPRAERALAIARPLAHELGVPLAVMAKPWFGSDGATESYLDAIVAWADRPAESAPEDAVVVEAMGAADAIRKLAQERAPALVCMTTHGRGRLRWATSGSVAEDFIHDATEPLVLVGPHCRDHWPGPARRIVVCVDGDESDRRSVEHACEWARRLGLELQLLSVFHPLDVESERPELVFGPLEEIAGREGVEVTTRQVFRSSFVAGALADSAEDEDATLLVMAARHHSTLARVALGSTTMATVHLAPCPVLVIPPTEG